MASLMPSGKQQYFDNNGNPLAGGKLYTYAAGTSTPLATYSDQAGTTPNTNPVVLNARGEATTFWGLSPYKVTLKTSADVEVWTQDNLYAQADSQSVAADLAIRVPEIGTYALLRAYTGTNTAYYVRGVASILDGGAGVFRVDSSDTTSADNGGTILVDASGRRWKREFSGTINALWKEGVSNVGVNCNTALQALINDAPDGASIRFPRGVYLNSGAVGLTLPKPVHLIFERGAKLLFDNNNATYLQTTSSDITIDDIWIDGGSTGWIRTGNAGIRVKDNGSAVSRITINRPRVEKVAGAGILVGWTYTISDVKIIDPVVRNTKADGVSLAYDVADAEIINPRCYDTGDDGVSIVSYSSASNPIRRVEVSGALSVNSAARGITVIGGQDIRISGQVINSTVQGFLLYQDAGAYNTYAPERIYIDVKVHGSAGIGAEIGRNAKDIAGNIQVTNAAGTRGILIGSGVGTEPKSLNFGLLAANGCSATGVEFNNAHQWSAGSIQVAENGTYGLVCGSNAKNFTIGAVSAYNNNTSATAGADNILFSSTVNFVIGTVNSVDDRGAPQIERTFDLDSNTNGVIGNFNGVRGTVVNTIPNIQGTNVNVRSSAEIVVKAGVPTASEIPARGFVLDTASGTGRAYFLVGGTPRYAALT